MVRSLQWRRMAIELSLLVAIGLLMAVLGPYRSLDVPPLRRTIYWLLAIIGGGAIGILIDFAIRKRIRGFWRAVLGVAILMTPPVTLFVWTLNAELLGQKVGPRGLLTLGCQVFVIAFLVMAVRALLWRRAIETRTVVMPPLPEAERAFRMRLSAKRRGARLIAIEAEDHYVRIHTDQGSELLTMRFSDALMELGQVHGHQLHRSWWAAGDAIEEVRWQRGSGEARLAGGLTAPVSRSFAASLRDAGWR
jgi:hypothetical protein